MRASIPFTVRPAAFAILLTLPVLISGCSSAALDDLLEAAAGGPAALDRETVAAGLRQALEIGSSRTVDRTSIVDGFFGNELIKILIPAELDKMAGRLRKLGLERQVDDLELQMNRAAEQAAGEAREILWAEIRALTIPDAVAILRGGQTAATDFLRSRTETEIRDRFQPIVVDRMEEVGLARLYSDLADRYNKLPFVTKTAVDLDAYVTQEALGGLFTILGEEEARIRRDPLARTTELLRRVFG
jgi:hypothetical protein